MDNHTLPLIALIQSRKSKPRPKFSLAIKKFRMWQSYYSHVLKAAVGNPNIIAMAFTQKLLAYTGIAESLQPKKLQSSQKVEKFFGNLDQLTKFLLTMSVQYGRNKKIRKARERRIISAFLGNRKKSFNKYFADVVYVTRKRNSTDKGRALYNLRSRLVHGGEWVTTFVDGLSHEVVQLRSPDWELVIDEKIISLDEVFLRGIARQAGIPLPSLKARVRKFIIEGGHFRFAKNLKPLGTILSSI